MPLLLVAIIGVAYAQSTSSNQCMLLKSGSDWGSTLQPKPSLSQCYKHNQEACCVSSHDTEIQNDYKDYLSGTCLREYDDLEFYWCLGCDPAMEAYIKMYTSAVNGNAQKIAGRDTVTQTDDDKETCSQSTCKGKLYICRSYAESLMYSSEGTGTMVGEVYDNCGLLKTSVSSSLGGKLPSTYFYDKAREQLVGGEDFRGRANGAAGFIAHSSAKPWGGAAANASPTAAQIQERSEHIFFDEMRPTYFPNSEFNIDFDATADCFSSSAQIVVGALATTMSVFVMMLLA